MSTSVDPDELAARVGLPSAAAHDEALARQAILTKPAGSLGRLEELSVWLAAAQGTCPPTLPRRARLVVFAGDHGVAARTSAYPPAVTAQMVLNLLAGGAAANVLAAQVDVGVRVLDLAVDIDWDAAVHSVPADLTRYKVRRGSMPLDREDALTADEARAAFAAGVAVADEEVDAGADLLIAGDMGIGNTTPAAALIGLMCRKNAAEVVGRGTGIDDDVWMVKCAAVRDGMFRARERLGDPMGLLAALGGADLAAMAGFLLGAAARGVPVILDGVVVGAAALVANAMAYRARNWWLAGHRSVEPAHGFVLDRLRLEPVVDFGMRLGEGTGALLALGVLRAAAATLGEMATFDGAGVSGPVEPT
ncbi:MAG: nicotinate-nucleotide--dimethylbenzimidazole phosphoribosyltransferase [Actinobacteria bacterium]|nr:nicotinate-nucleotide--dimethylbenzimidazole phosphoribosyltransferase [Actinomycetota bacterium]MCB9412222.1 nicotinate-nucleotide--dimethylbenzimidazole phosphoribosyltransferase [Actinomycetota bacterium]